MSFAIAIQGELGSNSELAVREFFSDRVSSPTIVPCRTFDELFDAVHDGVADGAMAPLENSLAGSIHEVWRLLVERPLPVFGELRLRITHCLIGLPGTELGQIRHVRSHPQALAQCERFLHELADVEVEAVYDTAGAVQMLAKSGGPHDAAIASAQAAIDHHMHIIARDLSEGENFTRFLLLGDVAADQTGDCRKTTLVLQMADSAAGMAAVMTHLQNHDLQVLKVETHKRPGVPWSYDVYLEVAGTTSETETQAAIEGLHTFSAACHLIGSYPMGQDIEPRIQTRS